jgi:hypothetical protein
VNNIRLVYDNALERATTLTASSEASAAVSAAKLRIDDKDTLWRATGTGATLRLTWPALEMLGCAALAPCNFSSAATKRVRLSREASKTNLLTYSEAFGDGSWEKIGLTLSGGIAAPDGTNNAFAMTATGADPYLDKALTLAPGTFTFSIFLRGVGGSVGKAPNVWFWNIGNLGGITSAVDARALGGGWVRYAATCTVTTGGTYRVRVDAPDVASAGDVVHAWGAQVESGALTSYFPSGATPGVRPAGYIDGWQSYDFDSGAVRCCPAPAVRLRGWTAAQAASAYAYGGGAYAVVWFPQQQALGMAIDIADPGNLQGYLEAACLVVAPYFSTQYNASDASMTPVDTTELYRKASGAQGADQGFTYRRVSIDLSAMPAADRTAFVNLLRNSRTYPVLISVFPGSQDLELERDNMVYGRRTKDSDIAIQFSTAYGGKIEVEEI